MSTGFLVRLFTSISIVISDGIDDTVSLDVILGASLELDVSDDVDGSLSKSIVDMEVSSIVNTTGQSDIVLVEGDSSVSDNESDLIVILDFEIELDPVEVESLEDTILSWLLSMVKLTSDIYPSCNLNGELLITALGTTPGELLVD